MGMILIENAAGERQCVERLDGNDGWTQVGPELPDGISVDDLALIGGEWVPSPQRARDRQWERAKVYSDGVAAGGFLLPGIGRIQTDAPSREAIRTLVDEARDRLAAGEADWSTAFVNEANEAVPVTASQIVGIYAAVRSFLGACYVARQATRAALEDAVAEGMTAEEITAIDITAGYPGQ